MKYRLTLAVILLLTAACTGQLPRSTMAMPLPLDIGEFPLNQEVQLAVQLRRGEQQENYLVALNTQRGAFSLVLLTPQGLPAYQLSQSGAELRLSTQTFASELLSPADWLAYLQLVFSTYPQSAAGLERGWLRQRELGQALYLCCKNTDTFTPVIDVRYTGEKPWYRAISLTDARNATVMMIQVLETSPVQP